MTKKEKDTIIDGECINAFDTRGPLLTVEYKKSQVGVNSGSIWFDIESAAGLSLAPPMHEELSNPEMTRWIKENLKGKPFEIISHIKLALPRELRKEYDDVLGLIGEVVPDKRSLLIEFVKSLNKVDNDTKLEKLIKETISLVTTSASIQKVGVQNLSKLQKLFPEMEKFTRRLLENSGFERALIIPALGARPDDRLHEIMTSIPSQNIPSGGITLVMEIGLMNTSTMQAIKKASVIISSG